MADPFDPARNAGSGYIFIFNILCALAPSIILMDFLGLDALNDDIFFDGKVEDVLLLTVHEMVLLRYYQSSVAMLVFLCITAVVFLSRVSNHNDFPFWRIFAHLKTGQSDVVEDARTKARVVACDVLNFPGISMGV